MLSCVLFVKAEQTKALMVSGQKSTTAVTLGLRPSAAGWVLRKEFEYEREGLSEVLCAQFLLVFWF